MIFLCFNCSPFKLLVQYHCFVLFSFSLFPYLQKLNDTEKLCTYCKRKATIDSSILQVHVVAGGSEGEGEVWRLGGRFRRKWERNPKANKYRKF